MKSKCCGSTYESSSFFFKSTLVTVVVVGSEVVLTAMTLSEPRVGLQRLLPIYNTSVDSLLKANLHIK